jgi:hypothetical protein
MERRNYTAQDAQEFEKASEQLRQNGFDDWTQDGIAHNADLIDQYFQTNRAVPVSVANIYKAVEARKSDFKWVSLAQAKYNMVATQEPDRANQLSNWLATQGSKPGQLMSQGDEAFENLRLLLSMLRGYEINTTTIFHAIDRVQAKPGPKLHFVRVPRRTEPLSSAAKSDKNYEPGKLFSRSDMVQNADGTWRSKTYAEQVRDREVQQAIDQPSAATISSRAAAEAKRQSEELRGATHSETEQLQRLLVTAPGTSEVDWVQTLAARQQMQSQFEKHRAVSRFIR